MTPLAERYGGNGPAAEVEYYVDRFGYKIRPPGDRRRPPNRLRVSSVKNVLPKNLIWWQMRMAARRLMEDPEGWGAVAGKIDLPLPDEDEALKEALRPAAGWLKGASDEYRDTAADRGTLIHAAVENMIQGGPALAPLTDPDDQACVEAVEEYLLERDLTLLETEMTLYSNDIAGTTDLWAIQPDGRHCLIDWKTSKAIYTDMAIQMVLYQNMDRAIVDTVPTGGKKDERRGHVIGWGPRLAADLYVCHVTPGRVTEHQVCPEDLGYLWDVCRGLMFIKKYIRDSEDYYRPARRPVWGATTTYGQPEEATE